VKKQVLNEEEQAAKALTDIQQAADAALRQVTGWCEAIGREAAQRLGPDAAVARADTAHLRALTVRGRLADAVRKLEGAAEEFGQAHNARTDDETDTKQSPGRKLGRWH
jgi:hypothetical protein